MEAATIIAWLKKEGESFVAGDVIYDMETEKAAQEVEAKLPGTMARIVVQEGIRVLVGTLLAVVADPGETLTEEQITQAIAEEPQAGVQESAAGGSEAAATAAHTDDTPRNVEPAGRIRVMPLARKKAQDLNIDLSVIQGTGPRGTITVEDVEKAASEASKGPKVRERRILKGVALSMADAVTRSWQIPQFVQITLIDASGLAARRKRLGPEIKNQYGIDLSYTDLILEAMVQAATEVPEANATFQENAIILYEDVNVSLAVANEEGLVVVPVIHGAQQKSLGELAVNLRDIAKRARAGMLTLDDIEGGTISLSNLGMYGVETGTPILTPPQSSLVFLGAMKDRPVVVDGAVVVRPTFYMSIAFDHRVLAGAIAAGFTGAVKKRLEAF